jgi:hypothetical protein
MCTTELINANIVHHLDSLTDNNLSSSGQPISEKYHGQT